MIQRATGPACVVLLVLGCGGDSAAPLEPPPAPAPAPIVRVQITDPARITADPARGPFFAPIDGWPVVVGPDTLRFTTKGSFTHPVHSGVPLSVYVPPEAIERRFYVPLNTTGSYRPTAPFESGIGAIMDTVQLRPPASGAAGDVFVADLNLRRDFVLSFNLTVAEQLASGQWEVNAGIPDARVTITGPTGAELAVLTTDFNGEVFVTPTANPQIFAPDWIDYRFELPQGFRCNPSALVGSIDIVRELEAFGTIQKVGSDPGGSGTTIRKIGHGRGAYCQAG